MTETFKCPACGAANNLPDGKTSMPCHYCGASIHLPQRGNDKLRDKPQLSKISLDEDSFYNRLSYINRNIDSLSEVIQVYSDDELIEISQLNLSKNNIKSLAGIARFTLNKLDLSSNKIEVIDQLPVFKGSLSISRPTAYSIEVDFSNNENLKSFSDEAIAKLNSYKHIDAIDFNLRGCPKFQPDELLKINFANMTFENGRSQITFALDTAQQFPTVLKDTGFQPTSVVNGVIWKYSGFNTEKRGTQSVKTNNASQTSMLDSLSVLNWVHLISPYLIAIVYKLSVGEEANFWVCLALSCFVMGILLTGARFGDKTEKTGRSFETKKYGRLDEYTTVKANIQEASENFWRITYLHTFVMVVCILIYALS